MTPRPVPGTSRQVHLSQMQSSGVYRTDLGLIFRITETVEGGLKVEVLSGEGWVPGRIGMAGLRLSPSTTKLSRAAVKQLPE